MYVITPVVSKTRNHGFDGSGVYCSKIDKYTNNNSLEYDYVSQAIDDKTPVEIVLDRGIYYKDNMNTLKLKRYNPYYWKILRGKYDLW